MTSPNEPATDLPALAGTWTLDPGGSSIAFRTKAMWILPVKGTLRVIEGAGTVAADGSVGGTLVIDAASIDTGNAKRDTHLRTGDFFAVVEYPTITFAATGARPEGDGRVRLEGMLTIRGQTRPLTVLAEVSVNEAVATATAEVDLDRSEWGLTWAKMGASVANRVAVHAQFRKD
jgi:polyisoprenoid-binding protein YceI